MAASASASRTPVSAMPAAKNVPSTESASGASWGTKALGPPKSAAMIGTSVTMAAP